VKPAGNLLH